MVQGAVRVHDRHPEIALRVRPALYDEYVRIREKDPDRAALTNVRWTGTLPYAAMENYDRMKSAMRAYRSLSANSSTESQKDAKYLAQDIAFYMGWLGHYTADGAQPLHDTIHHDGWQGPNPRNRDSPCKKGSLQHLPSTALSLCPATSRFLTGMP